MVPENKHWLRGPACRIRMFALEDSRIRLGDNKEAPPAQVVLARNAGLQNDLARAVIDPGK
jgi:hypothetical protein